MKLRYTRTALLQIEEALAYISARSPAAASELLRRIEAACALLQVHPHAGQATDRPGTRRLVLTPYPYNVFYRAASDAVTIIRFRHAARKPLPSARNR